ncbi:MAG: hypothetical protein JOZ57_12385 [Abitibacteriaceae bacterium]|nr:hypothetical protein [Abditibacteriaceae bacterium]
MPLSRLISDPLQEIAPADREEFWREAIARNFSLSQSLVWFVLCILLVDIYSIDIRNVLNFPRSVVLAVMAMHTALFSACLVFLSLRRWCQASSTAVEDSLPAVSVNQVPTRQGRLAASTTTQRQLWLSQGFNLVLFALLDGASLISLVHVHTNSLYVIGIFIIAIVFFLPTTFFRMLYGVNFLLSLLALAMVGPAGPWRAAAFCRALSPPCWPGCLPA